MTPAPLRKDVVQQRLVEMRGLLDYLDGRRGLTAEDLEADDALEARLATERAQRRLIELAVKVNAMLLAAAGEPPPADDHSSFTAAGRIGVVDDELARRLAPSAVSATASSTSTRRWTSGRWPRRSGRHRRTGPPS